MIEREPAPGEVMEFTALEYYDYSLLMDRRLQPGEYIISSGILHATISPFVWWKDYALRKDRALIRKMHDDMVRRRYRERWGIQAWDPKAYINALLRGKPSQEVVHRLSVFPYILFQIRRGEYCIYLVKYYLSLERHPTTYIWSPTQKVISYYEDIHRPRSFVGFYMYQPDSKAFRLEFKVEVDRVCEPYGIDPEDFNPEEAYLISRSTVEEMLDMLSARIPKLPPSHFLRKGGRGQEKRLSESP